MTIEATRIEVTAQALTPRETASPEGSFEAALSEAGATLVQASGNVANLLPGFAPTVAAAFSGHGGVGAASAALSEDGQGMLGGVLRGSGAVSLGGDRNLYYLELQEQMQDENRRFSTLSNVLKARHETAKNTINNVR